MICSQKPFRTGKELEQGKNYFIVLAKPGMAGFGTPCKKLSVCCSYCHRPMMNIQGSSSVTGCLSYKGFHRAVNSLFGGWGIYLHQKIPVPWRGEGSYTCKETERPKRCCWNSDFKTLKDRPQLSGENSPVVPNFLMRTVLSTNLTCGFITKYAKAKLSGIAELPVMVTMTLRARTAINCASWAD